MPETALDFIHAYVPPTHGSPYTLLLLHGTGGDERDLLPMGAELGGGAGLLSPRGKSVEGGMNRFFRRPSANGFDLEDLKSRTHELADFVVAAAERYALDPAKIVALGYSNGANVAAAMLLLRPGILAGAVLLRPMVPLVPDKMPDLTGLPIWIGGGRRDNVIGPEQTAKLAALFKEAGADVTLNWSPGGHELNQAELDLAGRFLATLERG